MKKQKVTMALEGEIIRQYRDHCREKGLVLSKQVENFMKKELEIENG